MHVGVWSNSSHLVGHKATDLIITHFCACTSTLPRSRDHKKKPTLADSHGFVYIKGSVQVASKSKDLVQIAFSSVNQTMSQQEVSEGMVKNDGMRCVLSCNS